MIATRAAFLITLTAVIQGAPNEAKNPAQIEFVKIAPGEFMMGCVEGDKDCLEDEVPRHKVRLTKGFEIGKYEVTQAQWEAVMGPVPTPARTRARRIPWIA